MSKWLTSFAGVIACLAAVPAAAHHPGGSANTNDAGPIVTISASTLEQGRFVAALVNEYISLGGLNDAALVAAAAQHQHVHSIGTIQSTALAFAYGVTNDLMVAVRVPYVTRTDIREGHHEHLGGGVVLNTVDFRGDTQGLGDTTVLGQYRFLNNRQYSMEAALLFGFRAPTGATNRRDPAGELFEAEFQPGSGAWDGLIGAAFTQRFGAWSFDTNVLYALAGTGTQNTNLGDRFLYNAGLSYRINGGAAPMSAHTHAHAHGHAHTHAHDHDHDHAAETKGRWGLDLVLELNGEWHAKQVEAGVIDPNSGGNTIYLSPGLRASYQNVSGFVSVGLPVVNQMNGLQSKPSVRLLTGLAAVF